MSMCVQFVLMKTNATAIAVAIAVYRSHPFHIRFVLLLFLYCLLVACGDVRLMLSFQMLKCSFHIIYFLLFTPIRKKKTENFFWLIHIFGTVDVCDFFKLNVYVTHFSIFISSFDFSSVALGILFSYGIHQCDCFSMGLPLCVNTMSAPCDFT